VPSFLIPLFKRLGLGKISPATTNSRKEELVSAKLVLAKKRKNNKLDRKLIFFKVSLLFVFYFKEKK